jgi:hypothetical protein
MLVLGGCPKSGGSTAAAAVVLKAGRGTQHFLPAADDVSRNARPLSEAAQNLSHAPRPAPGQVVPEVRQGLAQIYAAAEATERQYRKVLVDALCLGLDQLGDADEETRVSQEEWKGYFLDYFDQFGSNLITDYARGYAESKIDDLLTAFNLAEVSPSAARAYIQHCVSASP